MLRWIEIQKICDFYQYLQFYELKSLEFVVGSDSIVTHSLTHSEGKHNSLPLRASKIQKGKLTLRLIFLYNSMWITHMDCNN